MVDASRLRPGPLLLSLALWLALLSTNACYAEPADAASVPPDVTSAGAAKDARGSAIEVRIRLNISEAWSDATATWHRILGDRIYDSDVPQLNFVPEVRAQHCYGLYVGAGPVYCTGNNTVFVSIAELRRVSAKAKSIGDVGLAFLVAHELGHHIQKMSGRFRLLSGLMQINPQLQRELALRFELEADCLAGVWAANSPRFAASQDFRSGVAAALDEIGDDKLQRSAAAPGTPLTLTHGTSAQRRHWFETGLGGRTPQVCNVLEAPAP